MSTSLSSLLCFIVYLGGVVTCLRNFRTDFLEEWPTPGTGPHFDTSMPSNFTGLVGDTVDLVCKVKNLGNRTVLRLKRWRNSVEVRHIPEGQEVFVGAIDESQVSWVRHRDIHLLTVGRYTYTSDQRFEAQHFPHTEEWTLRIRYPQRKDSGFYECQISTTPPIGHPVFLTIVEPVTIIVGEPDLFVNKGSTINLTCLVKYAPDPPPTMIWRHNSENINFDSPRGGISLVTEKGRETSSRLMIQNAVPSDSGIYTCKPSNANPNCIRVHVVREEHPAAMHHGVSAYLHSDDKFRLFLTTIATTILFI